MSTPQINSKLKLFFALIFIVGSLFCPFSAVGQSKLDSMRFGKRIYISYGGVFTGYSDLWGHKVFLGANYMLSEKLGLDLNMAGSLINHVFYHQNNPDWTRYEISNGLEFSANGLLKLGNEKIRILTAVGPTLRYSYEHQPIAYGLDYNHTTGEYDWHIEYFEKQGFMFGGNVSLTLDFRLIKVIYIGPKVSMSFFPFDVYRFSYIGLNLSWK